MNGETHAWDSYTLTSAASAYVGRHYMTMIIKDGKVILTYPKKVVE